MNSPPDQECPSCSSAGPAGAFCAHCGCDISAPRSFWRILLRPRVFAVAPKERVWLPLISSSLFPHLADAMRRPFRHGVVLVFSGLLAFSMMEWLAPLVIVVCLGVPMLFALYVWQSGIFRDLSRGVLISGAGVGAATGATWWVWAGDLVAREYGVPVAAGSQLLHELSLGLISTVAGMVFMLAPIFLVRLFHRQVPESLDGFVLGAACALAYSAAGTTAWLAPQFATGLIDNYTRWRLFEEAYLYGFVDPVTTAVVGGLLGLSLWYRPGSRPDNGPARSRAVLNFLTAIGCAIYVGIYLIDAAQLPRTAEIVANTVLAAIGLMTLRAALQVALLHEETMPGTGAPVTCGSCGLTVPDRPFCSGCGTAAHAMSRTARYSAQRRGS